jgi:DNA-binding CsgD family transcriptional regulator
VSEAVDYALAAGASVLAGQCYDLATTPSYGPWLELFDRRHASRETPQLPATLSPAGMHPESSTSRTAWFDAVRTFIRDVATALPLVIVLEDMHWADDASLELLRYLARGLAAQRVLLLATYRDDEITRHHPLFQLVPLLVREAAAERLHISRFEDDALEALVTRRYALEPVDRTRLVAYLLRWSDGNPFFANELLRALEDERCLLRAGEDAAWRLTDIERSQTPELVQQMLETRLARLEDPTQRLLEVAALIGRDVPVDLWSVVTAADDTQLAGAIDEALAAGIVTQHEGGRQLRFSHALIREALVSRQILLRRRPWHRRVAEALMAGPQPDPAVVAHHLEQANDPRLVEWLILVGERAQQRFAWSMAAEHFERAQALLSADPALADKRAWLLFRVGLLLRHSDRGKSLAYLEEARQLSAALGAAALTQLAQANHGLVLCYGRDVRRGLSEMEAAVHALEALDEPQRAFLHDAESRLDAVLGVQGRGTVALWMAEVGRFDAARDLLAGWDASARDASADAHRATGLIEAYAGRPQLARSAFQRSQALYVARHDRDQAGDDLYHQYLNVQLPYAADQAAARRELARELQAAWTDPAEAAAHDWRVRAIAAIEAFIDGDWQAAHEAFDSHGAPPDWFSPLLVWRLLLAQRRGEIATVSAAMRRALPDGPATQPGERQYVVLDELQRLTIDVALDAQDAREAHSWLTAHDRLLHWSGAVLGRAHNRLLWARYQRLTGDTAAARRTAEVALAYAAEPRQPLALLGIHRFLGTLAIDARRFDAAGQSFEQAIQLATACAAPFERALTLLEMAVAQVESGVAADATALLDEARGICEPLGATPTLARIAELAASVSARPAVAAQSMGLTARELDVLRLLVEGQSNQDIAAALFISPHTVMRHISSILGKLGVESRTAAATYALRFRLV